jgi:large subunit ribosomal protein L21
MFAVIRTGGKQYRVAPQDKIKVDKIAGAVGDIVEFGEVLVLGGDGDAAATGEAAEGGEARASTPVEVGAPHVAGAAVAAEVLEQGRGPKVIAFKKRRRKNSRRKRGHRQEFTLVRITEILTGGRKPSRAAKTAHAEAAPEAGAGAEPAAAPPA